MPLGIVSNEEFESELTNSGMHPDATLPTISTSDTIIYEQPIVEPLKEKGRNEGDINVPHSVRKLIGDTAVFNGRQDALQLANQFGISSASVSGYTNPANSALSEANKFDIKNFLSKRRDKISKRAINKLNMAVSMISEDKLKDCKAIELSQVAKNMASVVGTLNPPEHESENKNPVQFHFYSPQVKNETHYEVITAKDTY